LQFQLSHEFLSPGGVDMAFKTTAACLAANEAMDKKVRVEVPTA
jgi:hypothetical protein